MAEQISQDVVKDAQSMSTSVPIDDTATPSKTTSAGNGTPSPQQTTTQATPSFDKSTAPPTSDNGHSTPSSKEEDAATGLAGSKSEAIAAEDVKVRLVNGDSGSQSASEDGPGSALSLDVSGGSDTDTSRDPGDAAKGSSRGHGRSNSVKKPTSFKSVSVTKNFLAKTAVSTPSGRADKGATLPGQTSSSQLTAKPRLVAKSGSGLGNMPRSGLSKLNGSGAGPDASKVWNKNRPTPPPPQKQFTDEELKQQYGIHMATRLQSDETGKEAKWADIDDDEDDWAPETVEWMDGTKTTVTSATESKPAPEEGKSPAPVKKEEAKPAEPAKTTPTPPPPSTTPKPSSTSSSTKTILKPGTHQPGTKQPGLTFKGSSDKPTLVAKSAAIPPTKSPWAALPPIEKVSPVQINPPTQPPLQARFGQRDPRGPDGLPAGQSPTKEIGPDDFSRSWREERSNRELFNSRSGRYEPVHETRRGSFLESGPRQPSVLQRPTQGQTGPAEPSPAFQTSRSGQSDTMSWGRRRASSNVSGGSGRLSFGRVPEGSAVVEEDAQRPHPPGFGGPDGLSPSGRPTLHSLGHNERGASPSRPGWGSHSPSLAHAQPASPYGSVASSGPNDLPPPGSQMPQMIQDPVLIQQQAMKERIERARLAKQKELEEEARKEAEKRERLKAKLASIPVVEKPKEESTSPASSGPGDAPAAKDKPLPVQSPPKPPLPPADGEVAQYGLMKVHPSHTVKKYSPARDPPASASTEAKAAGREGKPLSRPAQEQAPGQQNDRESQRSVSVASGSGQSHERSQQPWSNSSSEPYQGWGASIASTTSSSGNVWGPPQPKDKALGNGTFDSSYNRAPTRQTPQPVAHGPNVAPGPIGPPSKASSSVTVNQTSSQSSLPGYEQRTFPPNEMGQQSTPSGSAPSNSRPGPIAPPPKSQNAPSRFAARDWKSLASNIHQQDAEIAAKQQADYEKISQGRPDYTPVLKETFKQTTSGAELGKRVVVKTETFVHATGSSSAPSQQGETPAARPDATPLATGSESVSEEPSQRQTGTEKAQATSANSQQQQQQQQHPAQPGRGSRFFPRQSEASQPAESTADSDAPPPPETYETHHPAFAGDANRPKVNLPVPKARVKLPPVPSANPQPQPVSMPPRPTPIPRLGSQPIVAQTAWQERINSLFAPKAQVHQSARSPPTAQVLAVSSASKAPLDVPSHRNSATVSLPVKKSNVFVTEYDDNVGSKRSPEEALLEDREFGSLPRVFLPKKPHLNAHLPHQAPAQHRPNSKFHRSVDSTSAEIISFNLNDDADQRGFVIHVRVPGKGDKTVIMQRPKPRKGANFKQGKRSFSHRGSERDGRDSHSGSTSNSRDSPNSKPQSRKGSSTIQKEGGSQNASPRTGSSGNNRTWNRGSAQGTTAWSKPATTGVVH